MPRRLAALVVAAALPAPAAAIVTADRASERSCSMRLPAPGTLGISRSRYVPPRPGFVTARLGAAAGDCGLAPVDATTGARRGASSSAGGREVVTAAAD